VRGQGEKTIPDLVDKIKGLKSLVRHHDAEKTNEKVDSHCKELSWAELREAEQRYYEAQWRKKLRKLKLGITKDMAIIGSWLFSGYLLGVGEELERLEGSFGKALVFSGAAWFLLGIPIIIFTFEELSDKIEEFRAMKN
ncbi:MAG: hypothetical protein QXV17_04535, partial [Candidatus Micrarchaeaceae archaeon]